VNLDATELEALRRRAFAIAYRMLGSVSEAEDVVQDVLLRLHRVLESGERIESPRAYIATLATRQAIDVLRSARVRREAYVGEWLPEPLVEEAGGDPAQRAEMLESLSVAFLAVLERLSPDQRAVFLLRDVFGYGYGEIGEIVGKSHDNVRQLAVRARRHLREQRPRFDVASSERDRLAASFFGAVERGDMAALERCLAGDVVLHGDGGGKAPALATSISGRDRVARTILAWANLGRRFHGAIRPMTVNGGPGALVLDADDRVVAVWAIEVADGRVASIASIVNPDKLRHLGEVGALADALRSAGPGRTTVPRD
jgi:RNA polymerase sigma-70 factor (ECF subfamily)